MEFEFWPASLLRRFGSAWLQLPSKPSDATAIAAWPSAQVRAVSNPPSLSPSPSLCVSLSSPSLSLSQNILKAFQNAVVNLADTCGVWCLLDARKDRLAKFVESTLTALDNAGVHDGRLPEGSRRSSAKGLRSVFLSEARLVKRQWCQSCQSQARPALGRWASSTAAGEGRQGKAFFGNGLLNR